MSDRAFNQLALPVEEELHPPQTGEKPRIAFFGIFGIENLGNECTLQAILSNAIKLLPHADFHVISFNPEDTSNRHHVPASAVSLQDFSGVVRKGGMGGAIARLVRICRRLPRELKDWTFAVKTLRGTDLLIMTGTGMLTDYMTSAIGFPYHVFRWTAAARLAKCRVKYVGVGVGPIYQPLSRFFIKSALSLADYRSFRDESSKDRMVKHGFHADRDSVFPDLVFSIPPEVFPERVKPNQPPRRVGLGVMEHRDVHLWNFDEHQARYSSYLDKMCDFVAWLVSRNYSIRILQGDAKHDEGTRVELKSRLERRGINYENRGIIDEGSTTVEELISQIAKVDIVVSPRFHNLLLALMMNIPALSISYDPKNDSLLEGFGLGAYSQQLYELDLEKLIRQFTDLEGRAEELVPSIRIKSNACRALLEEQYEMIFGEFAEPHRS